LRLSFAIWRTLHATSSKVCPKRPPRPTNDFHATPPEPPELLDPECPPEPEPLMPPLLDPELELLLDPELLDAVPELELPLVPELEPLTVPELDPELLELVPASPPEVGVLALEQANRMAVALKPKPPRIFAVFMR
jgi:hypothetical protein